MLSDSTYDYLSSRNKVKTYNDDLENAKKQIEMLSFEKENFKVKIVGFCKKICILKENS